MIKDKAIECGNFVFEISYVSCCGERKVNEDFVLAADDEENIFLAVADGLGAHGGGDIASKEAVYTASEEFINIKKVSARNINKIFLAVNEKVKKNQTDSIKMKTTLACMLFRGGRMYASHIGDTRIYVFDGKKMKVTKDHSLAYAEVKKAKGTLDDVRKNPNRHILMAALGVDNPRRPDIFSEKIKKQNILICSDGFWQYVVESEMSDTLKSSETPHEWLEKMLKCYFEKEDKYKDNYSAICVMIKNKDRGGKFK